MDIPRLDSTPLLEFYRLRRTRKDHTLLIEIQGLHAAIQLQRIQYVCWFEYAPRYAIL
jgi:hypothetical protein